MLAIEMTSHNIHIVSGTVSGKGARIKEAFSLPAPWGSIRNGYIKNAKGIVTDLRGALLDHNLMKEKNVAFAVDGTALKRKEVEVPVERREIILQIMNREMGELIADEDHVVDYIVKDTFKKSKKKYMNCVLYAIPKVFLNDYRELSVESRLSLKSIDTLNESIIKQLNKTDIGILTVAPKKQKKKKKKKEKGDLSQEYKEAEQDIYSDVETEGLRNIQINGRVKLWVGLYYEKIKIMTNGIDGSVFTKTIMLEGVEQGYLEEEAGEEADSEKNMMIFYIKEIRQFLSFQKTVLPEQPIQEIYLYGEFSMLSKMCELTRAMVDLPTSYLPVPKGVKGLENKEYAKYAGAIGCLLRR